MNKIYSQLLIFYYVAHFMSFTKAAQHLNCSKAYISKQMNDLERAVGSALLHRSTRMVHLTLAGESLFMHAEIIAHEFQQLENTIASLQSKPIGVLRITSPSAYADNILAPNLPQFLNQHPEIRIEMKLTGQMLNLSDQKIDIAIRLTHEPPVDRIAKKIADYQMIICASPDFLEKKGEPRSPKDLSKYSCLVYLADKSQQYWPFIMDEEEVSIEVFPKLSANNSSLLYNAALEGTGIARLPNYVVRAAIERKELKPLLTEFYPSPIPIYAIYAQSRVIPPKVHVFLEFLQNIHRVC